MREQHHLGSKGDAAWRIGICLLLSLWHTDGVVSTLSANICSCSDFFSRKVLWVVFLNYAERQALTSERTLVPIKCVPPLGCPLSPLEKCWQHHVPVRLQHQYSFSSRWLSLAPLNVFPYVCFHSTAEKWLSKGSFPAGALGVSTKWQILWTFFCVFTYHTSPKFL